MDIWTLNLNQNLNQNQNPIHSVSGSGPRPKPTLHNLMLIVILVYTDFGENSNIAPIVLLSKMFDLRNVEGKQLWNLPSPVHIIRNSPYLLVDFILLPSLEILFVYDETMTITFGRFKPRQRCSKT